MIDPQTFDQVPPEGGCYYFDPATGKYVRIADWSQLPQSAPTQPEQEKE